MLTQELIEKFKEVYKEVFGKEIDQKLAFTAALKLLQVMRHGYKPMTTEEYARTKEYQQELRLGSLVEEMRKYLAIRWKEGVRVSWKRGFYFPKDESLLQKLTLLFLKEVPEYEDLILKQFLADPFGEKAVYYVGLLGWGKKLIQHAETLIPFLWQRGGKHEVHDAIMRVLFPLVVTRKLPMRISTILAVLTHKTEECKNKALVTFAFMPLSKKQKDHLRKYKAKFEKLALEKEEMISWPAKVVLERINLKMSPRA